MHHAQRTFAAAHRPGTFVELVRQNDGSALHRILTYDHEARPCWFLLKAHERGLLLLERTTYDDIIDLTQYGEVVASGWGHTPAP